MVATFGTKRGAQTGAYFNAIKNSFRHILFQFNLMKDRNRNPMEQTSPKDCVLYAERLRRFLFSKRSLEFVRNRREVLNLQLNSVACIGCCDLHNSGKRLADIYMEQYIATGQHPTCPMKMNLQNDIP